MRLEEAKQYLNSKGYILVEKNFERKIEYEPSCWNDLRFGKTTSYYFV